MTTAVDQQLSRLIHDVDLDMLAEIDLHGVTAWSQIMLRFAIHGVDFDIKAFKFILILSIVDADIYHILLNHLKNDAVKDFIDNEDIAEIIYLLFNPEIIRSDLFVRIFTSYSRACKMKRRTFTPTPLSIDNCSADNTISKYKFRLMDVLDKRFPRLFMRFFRLHYNDILLRDQEFISWLSARMSHKAKHNAEFKSYLDELTSLRRETQNIMSFMN